MHVIDIYADRDAAGLAELWEASQDVWLGGFHGGVPLTPARIRQAEENNDHLTTLVARSADQVIGYCSVRPRFGEPSVAYVGELGVHPAWHGKGVGRDLLREAIAFATRHGFPRIDLHTWVGNQRALSLYKRAGFLWVPGTHVLMENYLPSLLRQPLLEDFLERGDWYASLRQPIHLAPDDELEVGRPTFRYHFERNGRSLTAVIDRTSRAISSLVGDDWHVTLTAPIVSTSGQAASARLEIRLPDLAARTSVVATLRVTGAGNAERSAALDDRFIGDLEVPIEAPALAAPDTGKVTGILFAGGCTTTLAAAIIVAPLISIELLQSDAALAGVPQQVTVRLRNNRLQPAQFQISFMASDGLAISPHLQDVSLRPGASRDLPIQILASRPGLFELTAGVHRVAQRNELLQPVSTFPYPVVDEFDAIAHQTGEALVLENSHCRAQLALTGGVLELRERASGVQHSQLPTLGPPMPNPELSNLQFVGRIEKTATGWRALATAELPRWPGVCFERSVEIGASPVLRVQHRIRNRGPTDHVFSLSLSHAASGPATPALTTVLPLQSGRLVADGPQFPDWRDGAPPFAENWFVRQKDEGVFGVIWPGVAELRWEGWRGATLTLPDVLVPAQFERRFADVTLYVGAGNWQPVRATWQRQEISPPQLDASIAPIGPLALLPPAPLLLCSQQAAHENATVWSSAARPQAVDVEAVPPAGWQLNVAPVQLGRLDQGNLGNIQFTARRGAGRFADIGEVRLNGERDRAEAPVYLLAPGSSDLPVQVSEATRSDRKVYTIDNGYYQLAVAPDFAGSAIGFRESGVDFLKSAYPRPGVLPYCNPWFGGICPQVGPLGETEPGLGGYLDRESLTAGLVNDREFLGQQWRGLRLSSTLATANHVQVAVEYLTLGESPILLLGIEIENRGQVSIPFGVGWTVYLSDRAPDQARWLRWRDSLDGFRRCSRNKVEIIPAERWVLAGQGDAVSSVALAVAPPLNALAIDVGTDGAHLGAFGKITVPPSGTLRLLAALAIVERTVEAKVLAEALSRSAPA